MSTDEMNRIGEKIRTLRLQHGLTTRQLADQVGATNGQISRIENGHRKPRAELIIRMADFFGVTLDQLMRDDVEIE